MGQFKTDKILTCFRCPAKMEPITDDNGNIWAMIVLQKGGVKTYFALYVCPNCGASQIQRYKIETRKKKGL